MGKASYTIQIGNEEIEFEGPDDLSDAEIEELATKQLKAAKPGQSFAHPRYVGQRQAEPTDQSDSGALPAFLRNLPHDALFNFDDELTAAANAVIPGAASVDNTLGLSGGNQTNIYSDEAKGFWDAYNRNLADFKARREADTAQHPTASMAGRITGVLSTLPRAAGAAVVRAPQAIRTAIEAAPVSTAIVGGVTGGAVSGAGAGDPGHRAQSAAIGGMTGAAFGGSTAAAMEFGPAVAQYAKIFFNRGGKAEALGQMIKALSRDGFDVITPAGQQKLRDALKEFAGKPVSLADLGAATRSRTGVGLRTPSSVQQQSFDVINTRSSGQGQRLASDVRATVSPRTDVHALDEALNTQRDVEAKRLRDAALFEQAPLPAPATRPQIAVAEGPEAGLQRAMGQEVPETFAQTPAVVPPQAVGRTARMVDDPELQQLARLPLAQRALQAATKQATAERDLLAATGQNIDHLPDVEAAGSTLDMRTFDYLKRFLDDEVNRLYKRGDTQTFSAAEANQVKDLRNAIRGRLREAVPEYGDYLDAYGGSSEMIDALDAGRSFDQLDPERIMADQANRSVAAQELYRTGAARNLLDTIKDTKDARNPASRILNSDEARDQLAATGVSATNMARLNRSVEQERTLNLLPQEVAGSQTMQRQAAQADADAGAHLSLPFNPASPYGWAGMVGRKILNYTSHNRNDIVNSELLPRMLENNPAGVERVINELVQQGDIAAAKELRRLKRMRQITGVGSVMLGGPVAIQEDDSGY